MTLLQNILSFLTGALLTDTENYAALKFTFLLNKE